MIDVEIGLSEEKMDRINAILHGVPGGVEMAVTNVLNRALNTVRNTTGQQIREVYAISQTNLRTESTITMKRASTSDPIGYISFAGTAIPLYRFNVSPKQPGTGKTVKAAVLRSEAQTPFERAFIAQMKSGHLGVFERIPGAYMPSRKGANKHAEKIGKINKIIQGKHYPQFYGPSVAHMAGNTVVVEEVERAAQEMIDKNLDAEIDRILSGY